MVELPTHVRRVVARGHEYFYFQRNRGMPLEGPRVALPSDLYSLEFWQAYHEARGDTEPVGRAFKDLIAAYKISPEFTSRAPATQADYMRYLDIMRRAWGPLLVSGVRPKHVLKLRDAFAATPVAANHLLSVAKTLINWGIPREFTDTNPCTAIPKFVTEDGGARPWPIWAFDLIESHAREDIRHAVWLARYTGQRQADVLRMSKTDLEDGGINVTQQKTGKRLWIPLHQNLRTEMERWKINPPVDPRPDAEGPAIQHSTLQGSLDTADGLDAGGAHPPRGSHLPWASRLKRGEPARGGLRRCRRGIDHWHVASHDQAL